MKPGGFVRAVMLAGFLFLWLPILLLVAFAFSADRIPFQWGGFSLRWFGVLAANERLLEAAWLSLRIAAASATLAVLMGGGIAFALARFGPFRGRALFGALAGAPLVLPEVVIGLSLLLLFVALEGLIGWPAGRGSFTILLAHAGFGAAYVAVVVQARLAEAERSLEEAAMDLGASPFTAFRTITLPLIAPALIAGWLLAFTLSLDDVVIASFVSGPAGTTLPIALFSMLRLGLTPEVNALGALVVLVAGSMLALALWLLGRRQAGGAAMFQPWLLRYTRAMRVLPLALAMLLAACAERWEKPGATEADSDAAQSACTAQAAEQIRPAMVWMQVQPAYWDSGETHCWTGPNGATRCTRRPPRLRPPIYDWVDVNIPIRQEARAKCLAEQGFTYKGLRPLRLF